MSTLRISTNRAELDVERIHRFLSQEAYWSLGIPRDTVERAIAGSLCFGGFIEGEGLVAFGRVVTDAATFAYLADVFVLPEHRGHGHGKAVVAAAMAHPDLQGLRRLLLATSDAHGLYAGFGFGPAQPDKLMEIVRPDLYRDPSAAFRPAC